MAAEVIVSQKVARQKIVCKLVPTELAHSGQSAMSVTKLKYWFLTSRLTDKFEYAGDCAIVTFYSTAKYNWAQSAFAAAAGWKMEVTETVPL